MSGNPLGATGVDSFHLRKMPYSTQESIETRLALLGRQLGTSGCQEVEGLVALLSRGLTYPTLGKGKSSTQKCHFWWDMLVPWRVTYCFCWWMDIFFRWFLSIGVKTPKSWSWKNLLVQPMIFRRETVTWVPEGQSWSIPFTTHVWLDMNMPVASGW